MSLTKMGAFSFDHSNQQDELYKGMSSSEIKEAFDSRGIDLKNIINNLIDALQSVTDGNSGADNIKVTPIDASPDTVQGALEYIKSQIIVAQMGQLTDGSLTDVKLSNDPLDIKSRFITHQTESMPHQFTDGVKTYRYGFKVEGGALKFMYEEVI